jgi:hypothetical protein
MIIPGGNFKPEYFYKLINLLNFITYVQLMEMEGKNGHSEHQLEHSIFADNSLVDPSSNQNQGRWNMVEIVEISIAAAMTTAVLLPWFLSMAKKWEAWW